MSVRDELQACGATAMGQGFSQESFRTHDAIEGVNIENGYCAGVVLDWTRRVLQPNGREGSAHLEYASPRYAQNARKVATVRRMAKAYGGQSTSYVNETTHENLRNRLTQLSQVGVEQNWDTYGMGVGIPNDVAKLMAKVWEIPGGANSTFARFSMTREPSGALCISQITDLLAQLNRMDDPQRQANAADGREWAQFAATLDGRFNEIRVTETRQTTTRPFGNLRVVRSSPSTNYASPGAWLGTFRESALVVGGCTVVSMKPTTVSTGHQVAIHHTAESEFVLFDPNYGAFRCTWDALSRSMQHMFWRPYLRTAGAGATATVNINGRDVQKLDANLAIYCRRRNVNAQPTGEWVAMGYTVFERVV